MKRKHKLIGVGVLLALFLALVAVLSSTWFHSRVTAYAISLLEDRVGIRIEADSLDYTLQDRIHITAHNVRLSGKGEKAPFLTLESMTAELPYSVLWSSTTQVRSLVLTRPSFDFDRLPHFASSNAGPNIEIDQVLVNEGDVHIVGKKITDVHLELRMTPQKLEIAKIFGRYGSGSIQGSGSVSLEKQVNYAFKYTAGGDANLIGEFAPSMPRLAGPFEGDGTLQGRGPDFEIHFAFQAPAIRVEGSESFPLKGNAQYASASADAPLTLELTWQNLPLETVHQIFPDAPVMNSLSQGEFRFAGGSEFWRGAGHLQTTLKESSGPFPVSGLVVGDLAQGAIVLHESSVGSRSVSLDVSGALRQTDLRLSFSGKAGNVADLASLVPQLRHLPARADFQGTLSGSYSGMTIRGTVDARSGDSALHLGGEYAAGNKQFTAEFAGDLDGKLVSRWSGAGATGSIHFEGKGSGALQRPSLQAKLSSQDLAVQGIQIGAADAVLESDGRQLHAALNLPAYSTDLKGVYVWGNGQFSADGSFAGLKIRALRPMLPAKAADLDGEISGVLHVSGNSRSWKNAKGQFEFRDSFLVWTETRFDIAAGSRLDLANQKLSLDLHAKSDEGSLQLVGNVPIQETGQMDLQLSGDLNAAAANRVIRHWQLSGNATVAVRVQGTYSRPVITGSAELHSLNASDAQNRIHVRDLQGKVHFTGNEVDAKLEGLFNGAQTSVDAVVPVRNGAGKIEVSVTAFDAATLLPDSALSGFIDVHAVAEGQGLDLRKWHGSATLSTSGIGLQENMLRFPEPLRIDLTNGVVRVNPFHLNAQGILDITAGGDFDLTTRRVDAQMKGTGDLALLSSFVPQLQANGPIDITLAATGSLQAPVLNGMLHAAGASLRSSDYPIVLDEIMLEAPFDAKGIHLKSFSAKLGGGAVSGEGELPMVNGKPGDLNFRFTGRNVGLNYPEGLRTQLDADLQLIGPLSSSTLSGSVRILRSQYRENIDYQDRLINTLLSQKRTLETPAGSAARLSLNLDVKTVQDFQVRNNLAKMRASGDLKITGTISDPRIGGQVRVRSGSSLFFEGNEYFVERGILSLNGTRTLNPVVSALLTTTVLPIDDTTERQEYRISIPLEGTWDQLSDVEPTSDPPLSKFDIYSLLLTGRKSGFGQAATDIFQRQLTSYLTGKLFFNFQQRVAGALGLSRFDIIPTDLISSEQDPGARLILGREIVPGLNVEYSTLLSQHSEDTWVVTYRFRNHFNILFVDQETGAYTGGLRHTLQFGGSRSGQSRRKYRQEFKIALLETTMDPELNKDAILKSLGLRAGENYDGWAVADEADELKRSFQKSGFLFPLVEISEAHEGEVVKLHVTVSTRGLRSMEFPGVKISNDDRSKYQRWWREGLSESTVLLQITDDMLMKLQSDGYHRARVQPSHEQLPDRLVYRFEAIPGVRYTDTNVAFSGNTQYPSTDLNRDLGTLYASRQEMMLDALHRFHRFKDRVSALYITRGFLDVQVDAGSITYSQGQSPSALRNVKIREGQSWKIAAIEVSENQALPADLQQRLRLVPGALYDSQALNEDELTITEYFQQHGYRNAAVATNVRKEPGRGLIIRYELKTGIIARLAQIHITGNHSTNLGYIEKRIPLKSGDILTPAALMETQSNLSALQLFRRVSIEPKETSTPGLYDVEIRVFEAAPYSFTYGLRYDSEQKTEGEVQFQDSNLFGRGKNVLLYGRWDSLDSVYRLVFHSSPEAHRLETLTSVPWRTLFSLSYEESEKPSFFSKLTSVNLQRRWEIVGPLILLGNLEWEQGRVTSKINTGPIIFDLKQNVSRLRAIVIADLRDDPLDAHRGFFISNEVEHAPKFLKSDLVFTKNYSQYFQYFSFGRLVSASAVRIGIAGDLIGSEHFLAGGPNTIRGFGSNEVGPRSRVTGLPVGGEAVLILNEEIRFPIHSWLGGVVFYDGGNVYEKLSDLSLGDMRHTAGFGLRLTSPYGVLRMDAGFNLSPAADESSYVLHFGLGQAW